MCQARAAVLALILILAMLPALALPVAPGASAGASVGVARIQLALRYCLTLGDRSTYEATVVPVSCSFRENSTAIVSGEVRLSVGQFLSADGTTQLGSTVAFSGADSLLNLYVAPGPASLTIRSTGLNPPPSAGVDIDPEAGGVVPITYQLLSLVENHAPEFFDLQTSIATEPGVRVGDGFLIRDDGGNPDFAEVQVTTDARNGRAGVGSSRTGYRYTYLPDPGFVGVDTFTLTIRDDAPRPYTLSTSQVITVTVSGPPTITGLPDTLMTVEDTAVTVPFTVGDDFDAPTGLTVTVTDPGLGAVSLGGIGPDRLLTYTPDPDAFGADTFDVTVFDGTLSTTVTLPAVVSPVPDAPVITDSTVPGPVDASAAGPAGATVTFTAPTATDVDSPTPTVVCASAGGLRSGDTFPIGDTVVTCAATDDTGLTDTATFTVTVADGTGPVITLSGGVQDGRTYARRNLPPAPDCTAVDAVDGSVACTNGGFVQQPVFGTFTITYTATDAADNTTTATVTFTSDVRAVGPTATPRPTSTPAPPTATPRPRDPAPTATTPPVLGEPTARPTPRPRR